MAVVYLRKNENFDTLCRRFKKKVFNEGILKTVKKNEFYLKPSEKRRLAKIERIKKINKFKSRDKGKGF